MVECNLAKVEVASSNLVSRSRKFQKRFEHASNLFFHLSSPVLPDQVPEINSGEKSKLRIEFDENIFDAGQ